MVKHLDLMKLREEEIEKILEHLSEPSGLLGVPTATKVKSVSRMAFSVLLTRHLRLPF